MALPLSGAISLNDIHIEAGGATGTLASINDADIRGLLSPTPASGSTMSFDDWYGASSSTTMQLNLEGARGGGGQLSGSTFGGRGGNTIVDIEITADRNIYCTAGGRGGDGNAATEAGGGGAFSNVNMGEPNFSISIAIAGGGGGAGYSNFNGGNAGRGGDGAGTYSQPVAGQPPIYTYSDVARDFAIYPGNSGWGEADTTNPTGSSGGSSYPGKGGGGAGSSLNTPGSGGTGRYAGQAGVTTFWGQGGWAPCTGGRGGESSAGNSNQIGGGGTFGGVGTGGVGGNAVNASDSGGGGGGAGVSGGGGGSGGAYGSGGGGGAAGYYILQSSATQPSNVSSITRVGGSTGSRGAAGRIRVYREGVLVQTFTGSGTAAANGSVTVLL